MRRIVLISILMCLVAFTSCKNNQTVIDNKISFDFDWKFALNAQPGAEQPGFDDANWRVLDVPHDFSIEQPFDSAYRTGPSGGYAFSGIAWYRKHFATDSSFAEKKLSVLFDGVYCNSEVWINGHYMGIRPNGYSSFYYDITSYLNPIGENNVIAVKVNSSEQPNSRWYTGAGIYRHVWLEIQDRLHINQWGVFARTVEVNDQEVKMDVSIEVNNEYETDQQCMVVTKLLDSNDKVAGKAETKFKMKAGQQQIIEQSIALNNPNLWSVEQPNLYKLQVEVLSNNQVADVYSTGFGVRTFKFDPDKGFILNGKQVKLKGVNNHHDGGPIGAAVLNQTHKRQLSILKEMGCNALRMSHNPPAPELLAYADSLGFVVINEIFDEWMDGKSSHGYASHFEEWYERDVENWIRRDRNHPSVIAWSIGNELREQYNKANAQKIIPMLLDAAKKHDSTRPFTLACNEIVNFNNFGVLEQLDLVGYNYQEAFYKIDHEKYLNRVIYGSETVMYPYHDHDAWQMRSYQQWLDGQLEDYVAGEFLWTGFDYLGEAGIGHVGVGFEFWKTWPNWPWRGADCGVIDMCGHSKPGYWFRKALWNDEPMVYIAVQTDVSARNRNVVSFWNWPKVEAHWNHAISRDTLAVHVYTNVPNVELQLNGNSLGTRVWDLKNEAFLFWEVAYEPGKLEAIGKNNEGKTVSFAVQTAGEATKMVLTPDRKTIRANKQDLSYVTVQLLDANGIPVPFADNMIEFEVSGAGKLLALGNGNQQSHTSFKGGKMEAHLGKCLALVQSTDKKGEIIMTAKSGILPIATAILQAE